MPKLVSVNDALQNTFVHKYTYPWLENTLNPQPNPNISFISPKENPVLQGRSLNSGITWKDWVLLLGGGGVQPSNSNSIIDPYLRIFKSDRPVGYFENYPNLQPPWGMTVGKYRGINGRPIAESKPLDEYFWYYDGYERSLFDGWWQKLPTNPCKIYSVGMDKTLEQGGNNWLEPFGTYIWENNQNVRYDSPWYPTPSVYLEPGCYGCRLSLGKKLYTQEDVDKSAEEWMCLAIMEDKNEVETWVNIKACIYNLANSINISESSPEDPDRTWTKADFIFFVDSPVYARITHYTMGVNGTRYWQGVQIMGDIFHITPPISGYWSV